VEELKARFRPVKDLAVNDYGMGRELFRALRVNVSGADQGASLFAA
jgi:hypothetical protein